MTEQVTAILLCPGCGYDLRGIDSDRCPECGVEIDRAHGLVSQIPWEHRKQLGKWRAYFKTVAIAMVRPARLAAEMSRPVRFDDARRFARRTAVLAWLPLALTTIWLWLASMKLPVVPMPMSSSPGEWRWTGIGILVPHDNGRPWFVAALLRIDVGKMLSIGFALEVLIVATLMASLLLWVTFLCRAGSYFFHPADRSLARQNRGVALSYYACAPLALTPLVMPFSLYAFWSAGITRLFGPERLPMASRLSLAGYALPSLLLGWLLVSSLVLLKKTTGCGAARLLAMAITLPLIWTLLTVAAAMLPAIALLLALMLLSILP
jgi:hypothetical protein